MTTTTLGAITPGEAFVGLADQWHSQTVEVHSDSTVAVLINNEKKTAVALCGHNVSDQVRANAALYADAHNTAQKTGKLPSQLLQERDAKDAELQRLRAQVEAMRVAGNRLVGQLGGVLPNLNRHIRPAFTEVSVTIIDAWTASLNPTPAT